MKIYTTFGRCGKMEQRRKSGSTLVEFALILPILLILSMLLVQYGIVLNTTISLTNLAREGSRFAAVSPSSDTEIRDWVLARRPPGITLANNEIVITPTSTVSRVPNTPITVTINYNMKRKMFLPSRFFGVAVFGNGTYSTSSSMRIE